MRIGTATRLKSERLCGFDPRFGHHVCDSLGVAIAQSVELWIVIPVVLGSIPSSHP